jgi:hypothetical protein
MVYSDPTELGGRTLPARMKIIPVDKEEEFTEILYSELRFDLDLADDVFTLRNLKR